MKYINHDDRDDNDRASTTSFHLNPCILHIIKALMTDDQLTAKVPTTSTTNILCFCTVDCGQANYGSTKSAAVTQLANFTYISHFASGLVHLAMCHVPMCPCGHLPQKLTTIVHGAWCMDLNCPEKMSPSRIHL